ncbi:hypothetical protein [Priestia megaterium]|uniref:hypothetical protein n=1 Tax=Priestia megaterium TaxID=1404 RepID=UPI002E1B6495|nr:hypothetical protein [Priestia megaterium]
MKVGEIVEKLNTGSRYDELVSILGFSRDTIKQDLKRVDFQYDNKKKQMVFTGYESEYMNTLQIPYSELRKQGRKQKSSRNKKSVTKYSEYSQSLVRKNSDSSKTPSISLSEEEVSKLKSLLRSIDDNELFLEFAQLPSSKEKKKHSIEISLNTFDAFNEFSERYKGKRISKNDLIEIALVQLMKDFS